MNVKKMNAAEKHKQMLEYIASALYRGYNGDVEIQQQNAKDMLVKAPSGLTFFVMVHYLPSSITQQKYVEQYLKCMKQGLVPINIFYRGERNGMFFNTEYGSYNNRGSRKGRNVTRQSVRFLKDFEDNAAEEQARRSNVFMTQFELFAAMLGFGNVAYYQPRKEKTPECIRVYTPEAVDLIYDYISLDHKLRNKAVQKQNGNTNARKIRHMRKISEMPYIRLGKFVYDETMNAKAANIAHKLGIIYVPKIFTYGYVYEERVEKPLLL